MTNNKLIGITELAKQLNLIDKKTKKPSTHTLRFWEKEFKQIRPIKLAGNRRYYDQKSIDMIKLIKFLLKDQGLTTQGVKKVISNKVNSLDHYKSSSIKASYLKTNLKLKTKKILDKINQIKNGKKNTY
tara:strand:+ start:1019 stop:1405 length:387 start_codon:yes stop_codon:yes gene_type:complete